jgi:WD40 repeat protein
LDSTVRTWSSSQSSFEQTQCIEIGEPGDGFVYSLSLNEEETLLCSALGSGEVGLFQIDSNISSLISKIQGHTAATTKAQFTAWDPSSQIISCGNNQFLILWDILQ